MRGIKGNTIVSHISESRTFKEDCEPCIAFGSEIAASFSLIIAVKHSGLTNTLHLEEEVWSFSRTQIHIRVVSSSVSISLSLSLQKEAILQTIQLNKCHKLLHPICQAILGTGRNKT